jgi:hypothetical protein
MSFMVSPASGPQQALLLDSGSTDHVANDLDYLTDYHPLSEPEYLLGGGGDVEIKGYGTVRIPTSSGKYLTLTGAAYCPDMPTNLASLRKLMNAGIFFDSFRMMLRRANGCSVHRVFDKFDQFMLHEFQPNESQNQLSQTAALQIRRRNRPHRVSTAEGRLWHLRMGHAGNQALEKLETATRNAEIRGPAKAECEACAVAKIDAQISRVEPEGTTGTSIR